MALLKIQNLKPKSAIRWLVEVLILAVLLWLFFILAGRALCHIALAQIAELTNTKIKTESVHFHTDGSVLIKELIISPYEMQSDDETILKAETVYARFSLSSLFLLRPRLKDIDVDDFAFNAQYDLDTCSWNLSALTIKPPKGTSGKMPRIHLKAGTLQYSKISNGQVKVAVSVPLNAKFGFDEETQKGYSFDITTATMASGYGQSRLTGFWKPGSVTIAGGISSVDVPELEMEWIIDILAAELKYGRDNTYSMKLRIKDLQSKRSPSLDKLVLVGPAFLERSSPFAALQKFFSQYQPYGRIDIDLDASGNFKRLNESTLSGKVYCKDVAFCYYKFPYTVEHLVGQIDLTKNSAVLNNLKGKHGDVELFFNGWSRDFGPDWKYQIRIKSDNIALDNDLYSALNTKQKESWSAFSPTGFAAIDYRFNRRSQVDKEKKMTVDLRGADARYRRFPYPLKNLTGRLLFEQGDVVFSDVVSQADECKITLNGEIATDSINRPAYDISVKVNNIPLNSTLESSLPDGQRDLYNRIHPSGLADGRIKISGQDSEPATFTADLFFKKASLKSDRLSSPVSDISANAVFTPDLITVKNFSGRYGDGLVSLTGRIWPDQESQQSLYCLSLNFEQMRLNDDLLSFVPESLKEIISELKPQGKLNLRADLNKESPIEPPDYRITMDCLGDSANFPLFPYSLRDIAGTLSITKDTITFEDITATLGESVPVAAEASTIQLNGQIALADNSFSNALLNLSADDILLDECLMTSLPQHIQSLYSGLLPAGRFDLDFKNVRVLPTDDGQKSVDFTGDIRFKNCSFKLSDAETELDAVLKIKGLYDTSDGLGNCQAAFDGGTLRIQGKSFTNLRADIFYDPDRRCWSTEDLIADCYGGKSIGKFELKQPIGKASEYLLQVVFDNIDLQQFLSDTKDKKITENRYTSGRMDGSLSINARVGDSSSRIGVCRLAISDMQVGQLSPLGKLLQVLKLNEPKDFAFDQMFVDSYIRRNDLLVKKLDLSGQAIAFYGSGSMDLKTRNIDLELTARGRRLATDDPSVFQSLTEGLGRAVIKMEVTGDFYDPYVETTALPVIRDTLKILGTKPDTR
ncbi:MAG: hypothetical protein HQ580_08355 [Planctomycetes bacterium]|nr:hypothetical protein [Planctomycetota bacterium]